MMNVDIAVLFIARAYLIVWILNTKEQNERRDPESEKTRTISPLARAKQRFRNYNGTDAFEVTSVGYEVQK